MNGKKAAGIIISAFGIAGVLAALMVFVYYADNLIDYQRS